MNGDWVIKSINAFYEPPGAGIGGPTSGTGATSGGSFKSSYFNPLSVSDSDTVTTVTINGTKYPNRLLTLADFVGDMSGNFNIKATDLAAAFNTLPLAQFKHLPALAALEPVSGGGKRKQSRRKTSDKISIKRK